MSIPGGNITPILVDGVSISYELVNFNTLQTISHTGNYAQVNNNQFIFLKVRPHFAGFDKRVNRLLFVFKQYTSLSYDVYFSVCRANHFITSYNLPLRKFVSNNIINYEADITDLVSSDPTREYYFAITTASTMSFYVKGLNGPSASMITYSADIGSFSSTFFDRLKSFSLRNYHLDVDLLSLNPFYRFDLFNYQNELVSFNLSLINNFSKRDTSDIISNISTGFPKGFKLNVQQFIYQSGTRSYTYIDENYFSHIFNVFANDDGTSNMFYDENGSYLLLEVINSGYKIYCLDGSIKTFNSSGYIINETFVNGSHQSIVSYQYTNNLLTSILINNDSFVSITYGNSSITISLPSNSSIVLDFDSNGYLESINDQENSTYSVYYNEDVDGLIEEVMLDDGKSIFISFNQQLMIEDVSYYFLNNEEEYEMEKIFYFLNYPYTTILNEDNNLFYTYRFDNDGNITMLYSQEDEDGEVLSASRVLKTNGHVLSLSNDKPYYLNNISYSINGINHNGPYLENAVSVSYGSPLEFVLQPKGKGKCFLYFEHLRNHLNSYQTLNNLIVSISILDSNDQVLFDVLQNESLELNGFSKVNIFFKEFTLSDQHYNQKVRLNIYLSAGETTVTIKNVRLHYLDDNNDKFFGINIDTNTSNQDLTSEADSFYEFPNSLTASINNQNYQVTPSYNDLMASMAFKFFLNKNLLFYNDGKNACLGSASLNTHPLNTIKISIVNYSSAREINGNYYRNGYSAIITSFDSNAFIEKSVQYDYNFQTTSSSIKQIDNAYLLVSKHTSVPFGIIANPLPNQGTFYKLQQSTSYSYNEYGLLTNSNTMVFVDDEPSTNYQQAGFNHVYSSDYKYLNNINKKLYLINQETNSLSTSFQYDANGDLISQTDAYNKVTSFEYNKFHDLTSLVSYDLSAYHSNNIDYDSALNPHVLASSLNQDQTIFGYDVEGRIISISHDSIEISISHSINSETVSYQDGNQSYVVKEERSDFGLILATKINNQPILEFNYLNKYFDDVGTGNPNEDFLSSIIDKKDPNDFKTRSYSYDIYGHISRIQENGMAVEFSSHLFPQQANESDCGLTDPAIKNVSEYKIQNVSIRTENDYSVPYDSFFRHKTINDVNTTYKVYCNSDFSVSNASKSSTVGTYYNNNEHNYIYSFFGFYFDENGKVTSFPCSQTIFFSGATSYTIYYSYNNNGNISGISSTGFAINSSYFYNSFNELSSENNSSFGQISYQYDGRGNITSKTIQSNQDSIVYSYYYDSYNRLTHFVKTIGLNNSTTYYCNNYVFGRPSTYKNKTLQWDKNELVQYDNVTFSYDGYGRRIRKTTPNKVVDYTYIGSVLFEEKTTENGYTHTIRYLYDSDSNPIGFIYNSNVYFYIKDALNNVIAIYNQNNSLICRYSYDAYGNHNITWWDNDGYSIALLNPIRYRSYHFDNETNLYYLKSRYYDPETCRFVSMDDIAFLDPNTINGLNLYCYCFNNPIIYCDENGDYPLLAILCGIALVGLGLTIGGVASENNVLTAIGLTVVAIPALVSGSLALAAGIGGATLTGIVGGVTIAAGLGTAIFASAEYQEAFTDNNWMLDAGMDEGWYNGLMIATATIATLGTIASSIGYSFKIKSITEFGSIKGTKYKGIKFEQVSPKGKVRLRSLEWHKHLHGKHHHWQLNKWNGIFRKGGLRRWTWWLHRL